MENFIKKQKFDYIIKILLPSVGKSDAKHRKFLFSCLSDLGYMNHKSANVEENLNENLNEVPYEIYNNEETYPEERVDSTFNDYSSIDPYGFNRTFVSQGPETSYQSERLAEVQKRGITSQETEFQNVKEIVETLINTIQFPDMPFENIKKAALNNYLKILNYYKTNPLQLPARSGALKRGYIGYSIYYALLQFKISLSKEQLVSILGIDLSDLPKANEYIKLIIPGIDSYNVVEDNLCGMKKLLTDTFGNEIIVKINKIITDLKNKGIFGQTPSKSNIAAAIYYVCSIPQSKGGIYPQRLKIDSKPITYNLLESYCTGLTKDTVRKNVDKILKFKG